LRRLGRLRDAQWPALLRFAGLQQRHATVAHAQRSGHLTVGAGALDAQSDERYEGCEIQELLRSISHVLPPTGGSCHRGPKCRYGRYKFHRTTTRNDAAGETARSSDNSPREARSYERRRSLRLSLTREPEQAAQQADRAIVALLRRAREDLLELSDVEPQHAVGAAAIDLRAAEEDRLHLLAADRARQPLVGAAPDRADVA